MYLELKSVKVFCQLLNALQRNDRLCIESEPFMPLIIERIKDAVLTPYGEATEYSLSHTFKKDGELFHDPKMHFLVWDRRTEDCSGFDNVRIVPLSYQVDDMGIFDSGIESIDEDVIAFFPKLLREHTDFANEWLLRIYNQDYLNQLPCDQPVNLR